MIRAAYRTAAANRPLTYFLVIVFFLSKDVSNFISAGFVFVSIDSSRHWKISAGGHVTHCASRTVVTQVDVMRDVIADLCQRTVDSAYNDHHHINNYVVHSYRR